MLIQFNFKNYKSFRDETTLDLSAAKITDFSERVVTIGGEKILPLAAIYGANASGKSNIYSAFAFMSQYVINSFGYGDEDNKFEEISPSRFAFDEVSETADSSFEVFFTIPGDEKEKIYNYGFSLGLSGVTEEWLNYKAKTGRSYNTIFYRDDNSVDFVGIPSKSRDNIKIALEKQVLVVSLGAKLKIEKCKLVRDWFIHNHLTDFGDAVTNLYLFHKFPRGLESDEKFRGKIVDYFATFDDSIKDFIVEKVPSEDDSQNDYYDIRTLHKKIGSDEMAEIDLDDESAGTLKMFALFPMLQAVLQQGTVLFVDELNSKLHPLLVRNFMLCFLDPAININHAQLVMTTHDSWQLSNQFLRRDEIWFTEKDEDGVSTLFSLADFVDEDGSHIRKDENYEKNYLLGKYGAIPSLKNMNLFGGN